MLSWWTQHHQFSGEVSNLQTSFIDWNVPQLINIPIIALELWKSRTSPPNQWCWVQKSPRELSSHLISNLVAKESTLSYFLWPKTAALKKKKDKMTDFMWGPSCGELRSISVYWFFYLCLLVVSFGLKVHPKWLFVTSWITWILCHSLLWPRIRALRGFFTVD